MERLRFDSIFFGSVVNIAVLLLLTVLSVAVGFSTDHHFWMIVVLGAASIIVAFFSGGFVASRMSAPVQRLSLWVEGISVWAISTIVLASLIATFAGATLKTVLSQVGIGFVATIGVPSAIAEFSEMNPRFETDLKISEGKAVTQFKIGQEKSECFERGQGSGERTKKRN